MTTIKQSDLIDSIAGALQYISYYHPTDYIAHLARAYEREQSPAAKDAIAQILTNSKLSATGQRPICQDTGIVNVFLKVGMDVRWEGFTGSLDDAINEGVRRGYNHPDNTLRASVVADPQFARKNTKDNTPAVIFAEIVPGNTVEVTVAAKGGGSENKSKMVMLNPGDSVVDWVLKTVPTMGAGWCPPGMLGIGIGGSGPVFLDPPSLDLWPNVDWTPDYNKSRKVDLNTLTPAEVASWKPGDTLLLNGKMLTGRDAAHKRIQDMLAKGEKLPVDFTNRVIYYVGPVDPVKDEAVGPAGPTTATRMDGFTEMMLAKTGLIAMVGKAERGPVAIEAIKKHKSAYLMAVGGAAYLVSKAIKAAKVVGFADLGMEAIYEFDVVDMPVTVAVDAGGTSAHITGPAEWQKRIATGEFKGISVAGA
ncbi:MAG: fumarate hydratase [Curvibacter lanceolatus]|uniref:fumarate hydratase n=1 Tax=Curvibacter lanceolatus TaxID=86182 RepID=UPI002356EDC9|nr:fumarate hydratase [Curvibacter lanceolatus]MBV5295730.1 fumarate hydratase [Curvibacter lanceolatus]